MDKKIVLIILAIVFPYCRILKIWRQQKPRHQHSALPIFYIPSIVHVYWLVTKS